MIATNREHALVIIEFGLDGVEDVLGSLGPPPVLGLIPVIDACFIQHRRVGSFLQHRLH